jgi:alpha-tubulin suppressor-like RCC1 family protein
MRLLVQTPSIRARLWPGLVALVLWGCGGDDAGLGTVKPVASITVTPPTPTVALGGTAQLQATAKDADGAALTDRSMTWSSSDNAVATVSATGMVTGVAAGTSTITATSEGKSGTAAVTVLTAALGFITVSAGYDHTCGVTAAGDAYCWGTNERGQLGDGSTTDQVNPVLVSGGLSFTAVSAGLQYSCGVTAGGAAHCWGRNGIGQLGDGTTAEHLAPAPVSGGLSFATIVAGTVHTCGVTIAGAAYCWGGNNGKVGDGSTTHRLAPVAVAGGLSFVGVGVGSGHSCGLTDAGAAYCWGWNFSGVLGDGTTTDRLTPVPVSGGVSFVSLAVSFIHTCGVTAAGAAYCWGDNGYGELGVGTATGPETCVFPLPYGEEGSADCSTIPRPVAGGLSFASLSRGVHNGQSCGVTAAGAAYCWGYNGNGELGTGATTGPESCDEVNSPGVACSTAPTPVVGGVIFAEVSAGQAHTCGVTATGDAYCWGYNGNGQLGDGTTTNRLTPARVALE